LGYPDRVFIRVQEAMRYLTLLGRSFGKCFGVGLSLFIGCGGELEGDDAVVSSGSAASSTVGGGSTVAGAGGGASVPSTIAQGSATPVTTPSTVAASVCYGIVDTTPPTFTSCAFTNIGKLKAAACTYTVPLTAGTRLNPEYLRIYFDDDLGRLEIPYVGGVASCPTTGSAGGWYMTNVTGGTTDIGFCACTCEAAQLQEVTLSIECKGMSIF
jgi:hypothetical protein